MTGIVLDAGAFVAVERGHRDIIVTMAAAHRHDIDLRTSAAVLAQVWRGGAGRQAPLARALVGVDVIAVDEQMAREAGILLARSGTSDPIDATVVLVAEPGDTILTSDPADITRLVRSAGAAVAVHTC